LALHPVCSFIYYASKYQANVSIKGGWSQVASKEVGPRGQVIALDLLPVSPLKNVSFIQGDFLSPSVQLQLHNLLSTSASSTSLSDAPSSDTADSPIERRVDSVISDMMANMSGIKSRDIENSLQLCEAALGFAMGVLKTRSNKERTGPARGGILEKGGCLV
jgi:23S rRNA (uridine2552-2'-O)-methyltransferase